MKTVRMDPATCSLPLAMAVALVGRLFDGPIDIVADIHGATRPRVARSPARIDVNVGKASPGVWGFDVAAGSFGLRWQRRALGGSTARA